ncbi:MAG: 3-deoxy-7-phosphoheptulonate synthase [Chloroflexi bacterium]|nr:3-deoxy-7-phosphoheptulonate synthase [Chloroflexota bacterium]
MIIIMSNDFTPENLSDINKRLDDGGLQGKQIEGTEKTVIAVVGNVYPELRDEMSRMPGVASVVRISKPYKLSSRETKPENTVVDLPFNVQVGGNQFVVMAGPCSIESRDQLFETANAVKAAGAHVLRGGAFKPRSSPYAFRGLGEEGLKLLFEAREEFDMPVITEVLSVRDVELVAQYSDVLQIGARNMQNFILLDEVGKTGKPIMLKRALSGSIEEWLLASEYILSQDNPNLILCERGIRTFEKATRNTLDLGAIALVKQLSHLPVISDPSHGTGLWDLVEPMSLASIAVGADGLMIEVHPNPELALSDGPQSLKLDTFDNLMKVASNLANMVGRPMAELPSKS